MTKRKMVGFMGCALLAFLLFSCAGVRGQNEYPCGEKHFLWKVSGDSSSIWVLGSIHMADSSFYPLPPVVDSAFKASEILVVEMNVSEDSVNEATAGLVLKEGMLPAGTTLRDVISREAWNRLDSLAHEWNVPVGTFAPFRPWMVAMQVSALAIQQTGIVPELGVDMVLLDRAASMGKGIVELETPSEQIRVFSDESDSAGVVYLEKTLEEATRVDAMVDSLTEAWKCGNMRSLRRQLDADSSEKTFEKRLYEDRNRVMARKLDSLLSTRSRAFVVVGAAHLVKEKDNVLQMLEKKGYSVERY